MYLGCAIVVLGAALPHAKIRCAIRTLYIVNQILHKGHLVVSVNDLQTRCNHLHQEQQIQGDLQLKGISIRDICVNCCTSLLTQSICK